MLVFDIDGTLTDTVEVDGECFEESVLRVLGIRLEGDWSAFREVTDQGIAEELLEHHAEPERQALATRLREDFLDRLSQQARAQPERFREIAGACDLLESLAEQNVEFALATGAWRESALLKLAIAGLPSERLVSTSSETPVRSEIFARAAHGRENVTLIGDGLWDARVARHLGWRFVARARSSEKSEALLGAGASAVLPDWQKPPLDLLLAT